MRKAFALPTAIFFIVLLAGIGVYALSSASVSIQSAGDNYVLMQAKIYAKNFSLRALDDISIKNAQGLRTGIHGTNQLEYTVLATGEGEAAKFEVKREGNNSSNPFVKRFVKDTNDGSDAVDEEELVFEANATPNTANNNNFKLHTNKVNPCLKEGENTGQGRADAEKELRKKDHYPYYKIWVEVKRFEQGGITEIDMLPAREAQNSTAKIPAGDFVQIITHVGSCLSDLINPIYVKHIENYPIN